MSVERDAEGYVVAINGQALTDEVIEEWVQEVRDAAEAGELEELTPEEQAELDRIRKVGRPLMGSAPATVLSIRLTPELKRAVSEYADDQDVTQGEAIRRALMEFFHLAA